MREKLERKRQKNMEKIAKKKDGNEKKKEAKDEDNSSESDSDQAQQVANTTQPTELQPSQLSQQIQQQLELQQQVLALQNPNTFSEDSSQENDDGLDPNFVAQNINASITGKQEQLTQQFTQPSNDDRKFSLTSLDSSRKPSQNFENGEFDLDPNNLQQNYFQNVMPGKEIEIHDPNMTMAMENAQLMENEGFPEKNGEIFDMNNNLGNKEGDQKSVNFQISSRNNSFAQTPPEKKTATANTIPFSKLSKNLTKKLGKTLFVLVCAYQEDMATILNTYESLMNYQRNMVVFLVHDGQENKARMDCLKAMKQVIFKDADYPLKETKNYQFATYVTLPKEKYIKKICLISKKLNAGKRDSQLLFFNILNPKEYDGYPLEVDFADYDRQMEELREGLKLTRMMKFLEVQELHEKKVYHDLMHKGKVSRLKKILRRPKEFQRDFYLWLDMDTKIFNGLLNPLEKILLGDPEIAVVCPHLQIRRKNLSFLKPMILLQTIEMYISHVFYKGLFFFLLSILIPFHSIHLFSFCLFSDAEDAFGSVLCSPGACSLYRNDCIKTCVKDYKGDATDVNSIARKTLGEDRYLCTLFLLRGYQIRYQFAFSFFDFFFENLFFTIFPILQQKSKIFHGTLR